MAKSVLAGIGLPSNKYNIFYKKYSNPLNFSVDFQKKVMKSQKLCILRGISSCNKFSHKFILKPNISCNYNPRLACASAAFSCVKPSELEFVFCNSERKIDSKYTLKENENCLERIKLFSGFNSGVEVGDAKRETHLNNQYNVLLSLEKCVVPISPSLDDIQIKCCDKSTLKKRLDMKSIYYGRKFDCDIVNILPTIFGSQILKTTQNLNVNVRNNFNKEICSSKISNNFEAIQNPYTLYCSSSNKIAPTKGNDSKELGKPSEEVLTEVQNKLKEQLTNLFAIPLDYKMYSPDIIFENRITGNCTVGLFPYIRQASFLRLIGHIKFAFVKFEILKITRHPEDNTIRVRWRIVGISLFKSLPFVFTLKAYTLKEAEKKMDDWYDGFSIFHVKGNGIIYKHVADKMIPDDEMEMALKPSLATRLAALVGIGSKAGGPSQSAVTTSGIEVSDQKAGSHAHKSFDVSIYSGIM